MTRIISFSDGFTSASSPVVQGADQENYTILNNQAAPLALFTVDSADYKSVFVSFELGREDVSNEYRQAGSFIYHYDGASWFLDNGPYSGDDLIKTSIANPQEITMTTVTSLGVGTIRYTSGNMGASYEGNLRISITRIAVV